MVSSARLSWNLFPPCRNSSNHKQMVRSGRGNTNPNSHNLCNNTKKPTANLLCSAAGFSLWIPGTQPLFRPRICCCNSASSSLQHRAELCQRTHLPFCCFLPPPHVLPLWPSFPERFYFFHYRRCRFCLVRGLGPHDFFSLIQLRQLARGFCWSCCYIQVSKCCLPVSVVQF